MPEYVFRIIEPVNYTNFIWLFIFISITNLRIKYILIGEKSHNIKDWKDVNIINYAL
jgi:hypothetical protein